MRDLEFRNMQSSRKNDKKTSPAVTVAWGAMITALALVFSYVESLVPINFGIPGIKLGLANLAIVIAFVLLGGKKAYAISVIRILLAGFLFGNLMSIGYSLAGGVLSLAVMLLMYCRFGMSLFSVSVAGGIVHNIGQLLIAMAVVENLNLIYYAPVLLISGALTGLVIGVLSNVLLPVMKKAFHRLD